MQRARERDGEHGDGAHVPPVGRHIERVHQVLAQHDAIGRAEAQQHGVAHEHTGREEPWPPEDALQVDLFAAGLGQRGAEVEVDSQPTEGDDGRHRPDHQGHADGADVGVDGCWDGEDADANGFAQDDVNGGKRAQLIGFDVTGLLCEAGGHEQRRPWEETSILCRRELCCRADVTMTDSTLSGRQR